MPTWTPPIAAHAVAAGAPGHRILSPATLGLVQGILHGTPVWVWGLLAMLLTVGVSQLRARRIGLPRALAFPLAMLALSAWGVFSAFGVGVATAVWIATLGLLLPVLSRLPLARHATWDARERLFQMTGSAGPLLMIMFIFSLKYAVAVTLRLNPALVHDPGFALPVAVAYGAVNALLVARGWALWRMTGAGPVPRPPMATA